MKRYFTVLLLLSIGAVGFFGCIDCSEPEPVDTDFISDGDTIVVSGKINGEDNDVTGALLLSVAEGLATGEYFDEDKTGMGLIIYGWNSIWQFGYDTLWWPDFTITPTHGMDSASFTTTYQTLPLKFVGAVVQFGGLYKNCTGEGIGISGDKIAYDVISDTVSYGDNLRAIWVLYVDTLLQSSHVMILDSCQSTVAVGLALDTTPQVYGIRFIYNNADSVLVASSYEIDYNNDTTLVWVRWFSQDTIRSTANDTLYDMYLERSDGVWLVRDSLDRYMGTGNSATDYMTIYLLRVPSEGG